MARHIHRLQNQPTRHKNELQKPSYTTYHNHKPLIAAIADSLLNRAELEHTTILHKIRGHTNIRGNDLADVAAKRVVPNWDDISEHQKLTVTIDRQAKRPKYWIMYPPHAPPIQLATCPAPAGIGREVLV